MKYRLRLKEGRVLGPFGKEDLIKNISKIDLKGNEEVQIFPTGDWELLTTHKEFKNENFNLSANQDETYILNLGDLEDEGPETQESVGERRHDHQEFKYDISDEANLSVDDEDSEETEEEEVIEIVEEDIDRTVIRKMPEKEEVNDKTKINVDYKKYLAEEKERIKRELELQKEQDRLAKENEKEVEIEPDYENDKTQFFSLNDTKSELGSTIELEEAFEQKERTVSVKRREKTTKTTKPVVKKNYKIFILIGVLLCAFLFFDDKPSGSSLQKIKVFPPKVEFPARAVAEDPKLAKQYFQKGRSFQLKQTYLDDLKAIALYKKSMVNQYDNNPAAHHLIFLYADVVRNSQNYSYDANIIYNLVQYFQDRMYNNPDFATAGAYFYYVVGKTNAALNLLDRYKSLDGNKKTAKLFAVYLRALASSGDLVEAENIATSLESKKNKDLFTLITLYEYNKIKSDTQKTISYLKEANERFPDSIYFLLERAELFLAQEDLAEVKKILFKMNSLNVEGSKYFYSKYLKVKGFYHAQKKSFKKATRELSRSLKLYPDKDLLDRLARGEETDNKEINNLFEESKAKVLIKRSQEYLRNNNINEAFKYAVQASEASSLSIQAKLNLADIQVKKGYYDDALEQIKTLFDNNRANKEVLYALVSIYTEMYKFKEANQHLDLIDDKSTESYASAKAALYLKKEDFNLANGWLIKAINLNKLNEENIYKLAKLRILFHKYDSGKTTLNKAMDLDPYNVEYKLSYAKILYEVESARAAIGYLYDILKNFKDNIKILSEIGIYYYRSGEIKNYENIKKKIQNLSGNAIELNRFLLEAAKLDGKFPEIVKRCRAVIELSPGALDVRLYLAQILMELKKFKEAKTQLEEIGKRFSSYPRLSYFNARFYLLIKDTKTATLLGEKEIKENPNVVDGYLLLGGIYKDTKDLLKAREYYQKATQVAPDNVDAILGLAYVAFHRDQYDNALDQYQRAANIDPNRSEIYRLLGDTYRKIGQGQIAIKNYKQYLELSPNSSYKRAIESFIKTTE